MHNILANATQALEITKLQEINKQTQYQAALKVSLYVILSCCMQTYKLAQVYMSILALHADNPDLKISSLSFFLIW